MIILGRTESSDMIVGISKSSLNNHIVIYGTSGSGKTWAAREIAISAASAGMAVIDINFSQSEMYEALGRADEIKIKSAGFPIKFWRDEDDIRLSSQQILTIINGVDRIPRRQKFLEKLSFLFWNKRTETRSSSLNWPRRLIRLVK